MTAWWPMALQGAKITDRTTSTSGQFIVFSSDKGRREQVASEAEEVKRALLNYLNIRDDWKHAILVRLIEREIFQKPPPTFALTMHDAPDGTPRVQLNIAVLDAGDAARRKQEILRALLLEMIYRSEKSVAGKTYRYPPPWLVEGFTVALRMQDKPPDAALFARLIKRNETISLNEFLAQKPAAMDATSRLVYQAQAVALLRAWMETPKGKQGVLDYLREISGSEPSKGSLLTNFAGEDKVNRLWTLALARYSAMDRVDPLSAVETEAALAKILNVPLPPDPRKPKEKPLAGPAAFVAMAQRKDSKIVFQTMESELMRLQTRAHPLYQPIVGQYIGISRRLAKRKTAKIEKFIAEVEQVRKIVKKRMDDVDDYMNWFEVSEMPTRSGEFDNVLKSAAQYDLKKSPRGDALSRHLDAMEERGW